MNVTMNCAFLVLISFIAASGQRVGPSREQCRREAAQWGGQTGDPSDLTSLSLKELDSRGAEMLSCIPGDYEKTELYGRLERAYMDQKCVRLDLFLSHHNLIPQLYDEDEKGICCRKYINPAPTDGSGGRAKPESK
jgi:hypothetical protein